MCDIKGCNRPAEWVACVPDKGEQSILHRFCYKHVQYLPQYTKMLLTMFDIAAEKAERRLELIGKERSGYGYW